MSKPIKAWISRSTEEYSQDINLPATYEEIHEVLERVGVTAENCLIEQCEFEIRSMRLTTIAVKNPTIYELNHLASLLDDMDWMERNQFAGAATISKQTATAQLINIAMNVKSLENIECYPASNDYELGEFLVENELVEQLKGMTQEQAEWTTEFINHETLGEVMREREKGVFIDNAYVVISEELKPLYDGKYPTPTPADYIFKVGITKAPAGVMPNDENLVDLKLPISNTEYENAIKQTGATNLADCVFYEFKSTIPQFANIFEDINDFESLNKLAKMIATMKKYDLVTTYKAILETQQQLTLDTALELCKYTLDFTLDQNSMTAEEYARTKLQSLDIPMKENLLDVTNLKRYGNDLMKNDGVEMTPYGALVSSDGISLAERMEQVETPSQGMTMTMG